MLCARVVRGAASRAKALRPAAFIAVMPSALKGSSMPTRLAPDFMRVSSAACGERTFRTRSAANAAAASTGTPSPRKESEDSTIITPAMPKLAFTRIGPIIFGKRCLR
ncbi:MAG: hypothetical protein BWY40_01061 [bacterium ADurb.Bin270]|nr:MAG: hypothetical protein BWY40_01061 [bacterium ADurb.Bin270]